MLIVSLLVLQINFLVMRNRLKTVVLLKTSETQVRKIVFDGRMSRAVIFDQVRWRLKQKEYTQGQQQTTLIAFIMNFYALPVVTESNTKNDSTSYQKNYVLNLENNNDSFYLKILVRQILKLCLSFNFTLFSVTNLQNNFLSE